jgi:hypothetical protein
MGKLKGQKEFNLWKEGKPLSRKQVILANCFTCNGEEEGGVDCKGSENCPLYAYFPYKSGNERKMRQSKLLRAENEGFAKPQVSGEASAELKND